MNAKQRRVARRAADRQVAAEPLFLLEAFGRTFAASAAEVGKANRAIVEGITVELVHGPAASPPTDPAAPA